MKNKSTSEVVNLPKFDLSKFSTETNKGTKTGVTLWMPVEYRNKYYDLQKRSRNEFGKHIQKAIMQIIDSVEMSEV